MDIHPDDFRVTADNPLQIKKAATRIDDIYKFKEDYAGQLAKCIDTLDELQEKLYASSSHALLVIFQAMDAAGKDSTIRAVLTGINPQGCQVASFKRPTPLELRHDFLWRCIRHLPERGMIGVFNRSYYEEVLIVRVHPDILLGETIPDAPKDEADIWDQRYRSITELEAHLARNGTRIVKFYLHLSHEEQRKRLLDRIDTPRKNWKFDPIDLQERESWPKYMEAYEACVNATSTQHAPWYVVPADDKENMRLIVAQILIHTMKDMKLSFPDINETQKSEMEQARRHLMEKK